MNLRRLFILLFIISTSNGYAQILANDSLSRIINTRALSLISEYESIASLRNPIDTSSFFNLFNTKEAQIFNDIMPDNNLSKKVNLRNYYSLIRTYYNDTSYFSVAVSPYEIGPVTLEGKSTAYVSVLARKKVNSIAKNGLVYTDTFNIRFDIQVELVGNKYSINTIECITRRGEYLQVYPQYRGFNFTKQMPRDTIIVNDKIYPVNEFGYILLKDVYNTHEFLFVPYHNKVMFKYYRVPDNIPFIRNKLELKKDKNIVKINFWKWMTFADVQYHFIPNGASPIKPEGDTLGINPVNKGSFSNFITVNLVRRITPNGYFSVKFGGGIDVFNYQLNLASQINTYPAVDPDGDPYLRINKVFNIQETHNLIYITSPLVFQKGFTLGKNSVYLQAAYYFMLKFSSSYNLDAQATYAGFYDYLFNLTISENGVYDFGTFDFKLRNLPLVAKSLLTNYSVGIGYNRQFSRWAYLDIGLNYRAGGGYMFDENNKALSDSKKGINSLTNLTNKFKIEYVNMNIGLSIKI